MSASRDQRRTALVTGGNRGIGRETAAQLAAAGLRVKVAARDPAAAREAARELGDDTLACPLDVTRTRDIAACAELAAAQGGVDVLVHNAGVFPDPGVSVFDVDEAAVRAAFEVHFYGSLRLCRALMPGMLERGYGRVVNLTSGYAQLDGMGGELAAYRTSKAALNALTCILAAETTGDIKVNAVDPGWVRTDMGGAQAPRDPAAAAADVVHAATLPADGPNGTLLRYREVRPW